MKNWIIIAFLLVAGIGLGIGVTAIYSTKTKIKQQQTAMVAEQKRVQASIAETKQKQADANKDALIATLRAECTKGSTAYAQLTTVQKTKLSAPVCTGTN